MPHRPGLRRGRGASCPHLPSIETKSRQWCLTEPRVREGSEGNQDEILNNCAERWKVGKRQETSLGDPAWKADKGGA